MVFPRSGRPLISEREKQLLALLAAGLTDRQIAARLSIAVATVRSHLDRIRDKTGRRRRSQLTRLAIELGLEPGLEDWAIRPLFSGLPGLPD